MATILVTSSKSGFDPKPNMGANVAASCASHAPGNSMCWWAIKLRLAGHLVDPVELGPECARRRLFDRTLVHARSPVVGNFLLSRRPSLFLGGSRFQHLAQGDL